MGRLVERGYRIDPPQRGGASSDNDKVKLVQLSMRQKDALTVLLTGRAEKNFGDLIKRIVASKGLDFDLVALKTESGPNNMRFGSTMMYKQSFLEELIYTYRVAEEIKIYEDRFKQ